MAEREPAVGMDLGTTYSCVGIWRNGKVEIIVNEQGNRITPSCVAFNDRERLIGDGAMNQASNNSSNTIFDAKRLIGRRYSEESVQSDKKLWPFNVVDGGNDKPIIVVQYLGEENRFSAEEISAMILSKLKESAEAYLGCPVKKAVVTVPAYFTNSQRQATKDAGAIAGLDVMHVLNEPTAAALAYGIDNKDICKGGGTKRILIFDLGGGTFDVSLLELDRHGVLEVKATAGDTHLGGQDFDNRVVAHLVQVFEKKYNKAINSNAKSIRRLKTACEKAKKVLSTSLVTDISLDAFFEGIDFATRLSRVKFEELNSDLFDMCLGPLKQCLVDAKVERNSVDEVVLVGGSTRIPKIQEMLQEFFGGKQLSHKINPDEAVAYGASIQAASLHMGTNKKGPDVVLLDVTPLSLGVRDSNGFMNVVVPRNTRIPCKMENHRQTAYDYQTRALFEIFEGERPMAADNNLLGEFRLHGLRAAPRGEIEFLVIFKIDENGILNVSAKNKDTGDEDNITITRDKLTLNKDDISRMIREAKRLEYNDKERKKAIFAKHELEDYAARIQSLINESRVASKLGKESRCKIEYAIHEVIKWLEDNDDAPCSEYEHRKVMLKRAWEPIVIDLEIANLHINS